MKKIITLSLILFLSNSVNAEREFVYKGIKNINFKKNTLESIPKDEEICKFNATGIMPRYGNPLLIGVSFDLHNGEKFNFGTFISGTGSNAFFTNANLTTSSGQARNLVTIGSWWYASTRAAQSFSVTFLNPQKISRFNILDWMNGSGGVYGGINYNLQFLDCNNNIVFEHQISNGSLSPNIGVYGYLDLGLNY